MEIIGKLSSHSADRGAPRERGSKLDVSQSKVEFRPVGAINLT